MVQLVTLETANTYLTGKWHRRVVWRSLEQEVGARRRGVPAVPSPKDEHVNEEMQIEVSVTRVGKWKERVVGYALAKWERLMY